MPFLNPRVLNVVMSCHAFDPESSAVPLSLFYAPPQPTIRPHPQINSSGRALFHRFEVQGVRKQGKNENENHALQNMYLIETEGLLWMLQWQLVWTLSKRANELAWPCSCSLRVWPKCNWQCRMMRCEYSIDVVVLCCIVDIGMPFDCFDLADDAHSDVSSHTKSKLLEPLLKIHIIEESLRKKAFHKEMSFWYDRAITATSSTRRSGMVSDGVEIKQDETTASRISKVEIGQGESSKKINQYHCCPVWSSRFGR
jgi:hypothetical protein